MASGESPGSPRKKVKIELSNSMDTELDFAPRIPEISSNINHIVLPSDQPQNERQIPPRNFNSGDVRHPRDTTSQAKMAIETSESELDQLEKEKACGITEFVRPDLLGFSGTLKKRYTDFLVNEILPSGEVVHLTTLKAAKKAQQIEGHIEKAALHSIEKSPFDKIPSPQRASGQDREALEVKHEAFALEPVSPPFIDKNEEEKTQKVETQTPQQSIAHSQLATTSGLKISPKSSPRSSPAKETRNRQQFHLHHTDNGWVEYDDEKEYKEKEKEEEAGSASNTVVLDVGSTNIAPKKENMSPTTDDQIPAPVNQHEVPCTPNASSTAQWQAYADPNGESSAVSKISDEDKTILLSYFSESVVDAIRSLYNRVLASPHRSTRDYGTVKTAVIDRQLRTKIHQDIRRIFHSRLETMTDKDGAMIVSAMPRGTNSYNSTPNSGRNERGQPSGRRNQNGSRGQPGGFGKLKWSELGGEFLHFTLYKENKDTMECISWLSKVLQLGPKAFEFAGTKDRRAISAQRVSIYRQTIGRMIDAGKSLRQANIGDYEYRPHALQLGELTGNEFTITLRDCKFEGSSPTGIGSDQAHVIVDEALNNLVNRGFINYYGLQRFGTFSTSTSDVGVKLLQGDFKSAVEAVLHYTPESLAASQDALLEAHGLSRDDKARSHAIHTFQTTGKAQRALADIPRKFSAESAIIRHLGSRSNQAKDYLGAILSIQRNLRLMYVHAYQSLVWNMAASKRWSMYGDTVVNGDLVLVTKHADEAESPPKAQEVDEDGEPIFHPAPEDRATNVDDLFTRARVLSKEEAESGKYTIFDIVLPTPGFDILYPANEIGKYYEEFMASPKGGGLNPHDMRRPQKDFSLSGTYRKIFARPGKDTSFEIKTYEDDNEQFVETDLDRLKKARDASHPSNDDSVMSGAGMDIVGEQAGGAGNGIAKDGGPGDNADDNVSKPDSEDTEAGGGVSLNRKNEKIAVILKFQLGSSQYATMALRELMKAGVKTYKPDFGGGR